MAEVKDKIVTVDALKAIHDYDESTFLKKNGALTTLGITATATELNKMDGVTATTAEINKLKGLTATTAELNYVDGVTSNIQTQLDNKHTIGNNVTVEKTGSTPFLSLKVKDTSLESRIYKNANTTNDYGTIIQDYNSSGERDALVLRRNTTLENKLMLKVQNSDGSDEQFLLYGQHTPNLQHSNENGNCVIGWDNYDNGSGDTNIYGQNVHIYALNSDGSTPTGAVFVARNENNHTLINNEAHLNTAKVSDTYIYGRAVHIDTNDTNFIVDGIQLAKVSETTCTLASGWGQYTDGGKVYANRYGKVVTVTGALKNTTAFTSGSTKVKMFTVPSEYRPAHAVYFVCAGAGVMRWLLTIGTDGIAYASRYGTTAYVDVPANEGYFPFTATYVIP